MYDETCCSHHLLHPAFCIIDSVFNGKWYFILDDGAAPQHFKVPKPSPKPKPSSMGLAAGVFGRTLLAQKFWVVELSTVLSNGHPMVKW
mmetsp:Transcript_105788/g.178714  ORF Transcript_105788/g.178714 Transcript_105788/m.178714 type:complete len:89 (-) Transcript_105788:625-891(-)